MDSTRQICECVTPKMGRSESHRGIDANAFEKVSEHPQTILIVIKKLAVCHVHRWKRQQCVGASRYDVSFTTNVQVDAAHSNAPSRKTS